MSIEQSAFGSKSKQGESPVWIGRQPEYDEDYNEYCEDCAHDCEIKPPFDYMSAAHAMMEERMLEEYEKNW